MGIFTPKSMVVRKMFSHAIYLISNALGDLSYSGASYLLCMFPSVEETLSTKKESQ
jgi:hypothetical protein